MEMFSDSEVGSRWPPSARRPRLKIDKMRQWLADFSTALKSMGTTTIVDTDEWTNEHTNPENSQIENKKEWTTYVTMTCIEK